MTSPPPTTRIKPITRADRFEALGREAALAGVGIGDRQAALTEACGPFALGDRSAWLVGHERAMRDLADMAVESARLSAAAALSAAGFTVEPTDSMQDLYVSDGPNRWLVRVLAVEDDSTRKESQ